MAVGNAQLQDSIKHTRVLMGGKSQASQDRVIASEVRRSRGVRIQNNKDEYF